MDGNTLTDRYVREVVRRIPADQRDDVADELRTTITDTVEAREDGFPAVTERQVLAEMGDPRQLAARYADRLLVLIGPELYPSYISLLKALLVTVLPIVTVVLVVLDLIDSKDAGSVVGTAVGTVLNVGGQMIAWVTVIYALIERSVQRDDVAASAAGPRWTPDDLPDAKPEDDGGVVACAAVVLNLALIGLVVWQRVAEPYTVDGGESLQILHPDLWSGWIWPILAGLVGVVVLEVIRIVVRGWTVALVVAYAVAETVLAVPLAWVLFRHDLFNPAFLADANGGWHAPDTFYTLAALGVLAIGAIEVGRRWREVRH